MTMNLSVVRAKRWLSGRSGRRVMKLFVVTAGIVWCSSWPGLLGGRGNETLADSCQPTAQRLAALADQPDVDLGTVAPDEAAQRIRALLTRRAPGDLERAGAMLDRALANPPPERARRRGLERLRAGYRRLKHEEETLCAGVASAPQSLALHAGDPAQANMPGPLPPQVIR